MTAQTPTVLKTYFETGDIPTQAQFTDLVDSIDIKVVKYATITAMLAATAPTDGTVIQTYGYTTAGLGGNEYYYSSGSAATINGVTVLPGVAGTMSLDATGVFDGTAGTGRYLAVTPKYDPVLAGADNTGSTDAVKFWLATISAAPAGATIEPSPGTYKIGSKITFSKSVTLDAYGVLLNRDADSMASVVKFDGDQSFVKGLEINGGRLHADIATWTNTFCYLFWGGGTNFYMEDCYIHDGHDTYAQTLGVILTARFNSVINCRIRDGGIRNLRQQGECNYSNGLLSENSTNTIAYRHFSVTNSADWANPIHRHINLTVINENSHEDNPAKLGVWDNEPNIRIHTLEFVDCVFDWRNSSSDAGAAGAGQVSSFIKVEAVRNTIFTNITHIGDSLEDQRAFLNMAARSEDTPFMSVKLTNVRSPGGLYFNTVDPINELITTNCEFGFKSDGTPALINGMSQGPSTHKVTDWTIKNCKWQGMIQHAFYQRLPADPNQRIRYDGLHLSWYTAEGNYKYVHLEGYVTSTHHVVGTGLRMTNSSSGTNFLGSGPSSRLMLSHIDGNPKRLAFGIVVGQHPDNNTSTGYAASGSATTVHPTPNDDLPDTGLVTLSVDEPTGEFRDAGGGFVSGGFLTGHQFTSTGFSNAGNNSTWTIASRTATAITVTDSSGMVTETGGGNEQLVAFANKFPKVIGFLGDIIENLDVANGYNEQGWIHNGTGWVERT